MNRASHSLLERSLTMSYAHIGMSHTSHTPIAHPHFTHSILAVSYANMGITNMSHTTIGACFKYQTAKSPTLMSRASQN